MADHFWLQPKSRRLEFKEGWPGDDIKVAIFDDMLEITSPGPLTDTLAPEALGTGRSEIRNRVLAPIFKELGLIEAWGTGIRRMRAELESYPEVELVLQEATQAFQVQFVRKKAQEAITFEVTPEVRLLSVLRGEMSREQIQESLSLRDEKHFRTAYLVPALARLLRISGLRDEVPDDHAGLIDVLEPLNVEARYPAHKERLMQSLTHERSAKILRQSKELYAWIRSKLSNR